MGLGEPSPFGRDLKRQFVETTGFYRPMVSLSFAANERLGGAGPKGYGLTNLALALLTAAAIAGLARALQLPAGACLFAAGVWLMNFHGINMAAVVDQRPHGAVPDALCGARRHRRREGRPAAAAMLAFAAMLSKEEAVLLPVALLVILAMTTRRSPAEAQRCRERRRACVRRRSALSIAPPP